MCGLENKIILDTNNRLFCKPVVPNIKFEQSQHIIAHDVNENNILTIKYKLI